ncbi:hypothetical protein BDV97DRAFT_290144 [Delphinella strobiligena]|nr:hypothetical protein BDV97DRAFT_290144 [Delphinella strobiligena]
MERTWQTERPQAAKKTSVLKAPFARRSTGQPVDSANPHDESDSSSWSSSSDDEAGQKQEKGLKNKEKASQTTGKSSRKPRLHKDRDFSHFNVGNNNYQSKGRVSRRDGRLNISVNETASNGYIAKALGHSIKHHLDLPNRHGHNNMEREMAPAESHHGDGDTLIRPKSGETASMASSVHHAATRPRLNIVVMVIGSRGDIQPFMQIGRVLKQYGHRVRIATHPAFKEFVEKDVGLEFFSVGGNPSELMAFMVKNPGLIPKVETVRQGEIARRRNQMAEMFGGFWRACVNTTDDEKDKQNMKLLGDRAPFIADAIIANPPSFAHVHIAERLGIPLHIMFTFPYTPTQAFPHPLANINSQKSNVDPNYVNFMSYPLVEMMTWQGLGDLVNNFRVKTLGLEPVSSLWAPGALYRMKVPYTYMWSPALVSKPEDWGPEIDIGGYVFLDLASNYKPPKELEDFLNAGDAPIYIGFGSIVVDDPDKFTNMIFEAVEKAGVRALVSKGWGGLGGDNTPDNIFMLENTPHDWLFPRCSAVVHHGGAGTCAIGLKCAKPTMIVPFFGDQPFWGAMVASHKAGAHESIPYKKLTADKLAEGIKQCLTDEARENVQKLADSINNEGDGAENAVKSFHRSLPFAGRQNMRCSILEDRVAVWSLKRSSLRLSALAAHILVENKKIQWHELRLLRHCEWNDFDGPGEPITGIGSALVDTGAGLVKGVGMVPLRMAKHIRKREKHELKKKERMERKEEKQRAKEAARKQTGHSENEPPSDEKQKESRPSGPEHHDTTRTMESQMSADPSQPLVQELAADAGRGLLTSAGAIASAPLDLGLAIAQGFHNAPRLYGDASVRKPVRITGMFSGAKAARNEFMYGVYDGCTGLVKQPLHAWQDAPSSVGKIGGLGKGFARGLGGFVLKDVTAVIAPPVMLCQGVRKEVIKRIGGPGTVGFIRRAHIVQGQKDLNALREADKDDGSHHVQETQDAVDHGWHIMKQVWHEKEEYQQQHGGRLRGRLSIHKEERKWHENGALENIQAAERALETKKQGKSMEKMFAQRRHEIDIAEQSRAPAMEQPVAYEEGGHAVAPNGRYHSHPQSSKTTEEPEDSPSQSVNRNEEAGKQDTGAIDSSGMCKVKEEEETKIDGSKAEDEDAETSDTAVGSEDEVEHLKEVGAGNQNRDYKKSPAGRLNDVEIGKHDADRYAGKTGIQA